MYFHKPQEKPRKWGSFQDVQYAIRKNAEKIYGVDADSIVLAMPLFWGLPPLDYSGKNNHGTNHGATFKDGSLDFDGGDDYVKIPSITYNTGGGSVTFAFWAKRDVTGVTQTIFGGGVSGYKNLRFMSNGLIRLETNVNGDNCTVAFANDDIDWHHYVLSVSSGACTVYQDAVALDIPDSLANDVTLDRIGASTDSAYLFNGLMGEVRISNVAYTADQIALFYDRPWALYQPVSRPVYFFQAIENIDVSAITDALLLTEYAASINAEINFTAEIDALIITEYAAIVNAEVSISAGVDALIITEAAAIIKVDSNIQAEADALVITENPATVNTEISMSAGIDALAITEYIADVNLNVNVSAGVDALIIAESAANINAEVSIPAEIDALVLTEYQAVVDIDEAIEVIAGIDALTLTEYAVIVNAEINISAGADALVITENIATVKVDNNIQADIDALILAENVATVNVEVSISAGIDILTLTEYQAVVNAETNISASIDTLTLSSFAADIKVDIDIQTILEALVIAEYSASVAIGTGSIKFISEQLGLNQIQGFF